MADTATHRQSKAHRIEILETKQHVRVEIDGVTVADTVRPTVLTEGSLPARYYIPTEDVRTDLLTPTDTVWHCPFKGDATYWSVTVNGKEHKDIVWSYPEPIPESSKIEKLMCFFNERVDIYVDDEKQECGPTPWSD